MLAYQPFGLNGCAALTALEPGTLGRSKVIDSKVHKTSVTMLDESKYVAAALDSMKTVVSGVRYRRY